MIRFKDRYAILFRKLSSQNTVNAFHKDTICDVNNREKCIKNMKKFVPKIDKAPESYAAVLIPIVCDHDRGQTLSVLYTLRSGKLRTHVRQVAFPGGIKDPSDSSYTECALRETEEEIGIKPATVEVWGEGQLLLPRNGPAIMPVVGYIPDFKRDVLKLNTNEVEKVFTIPIQYLCSDKCKKHTQFRTDKGYSIPVYTCGEEKIWGITAVITNLFLHSLMPKNAYSSKIGYVNKYRPVS